MVPRVGDCYAVASMRRSENAAVADLRRVAYGIRMRLYGDVEEIPGEEKSKSQSLAKVAVGKTRRWRAWETGLSKSSVCLLIVRLGSSQGYQDSKLTWDGVK
jgi:hypothetical protein